MNNRTAISLPVIALLLASFASGCQQLGSDGTIGDGIVVWSGEQFGFCGGYCFRELEIQANQMVLSTKPNPFRADTSAYPALQNESPVSKARWDSLLSFVDESVFVGLDEVYGCPDCADGGSEWIDISFNSGPRYRVTFEYGSTVTGIDALVTYVRFLRRDAIDRAAIVNN